MLTHIMRVTTKDTPFYSCEYGLTGAVAYHTHGVDAIPSSVKHYQAVEGLQRPSI